MASLSVTVGHNLSEIGEALANNNDLYCYANWICTILKQSRRCKKKNISRQKRLFRTFESKYDTIYAEPKFLGKKLA